MLLRLSLEAESVKGRLLPCQMRHARRPHDQVKPLLRMMMVLFHLKIRLVLRR